MEVKGTSQGWQTALDSNPNCVDPMQSAQPAQSNIITSYGESANNKKLDGKMIINEKAVTEEDVKKSVEKLNKLLEDKPTHVEYEVYGKFRDLTIRIVDDNTKQVIKEIPPKKIIDMVDKLCELAGVFMDQKA